jgi:hypothetical protein
VVAKMRGSSSWLVRLSIIVPIATLTVTLPAILAVVFGVSPKEKGWWVVAGFVAVVIGSAPGYLYACLEAPQAQRATLTEKVWVRSSLACVGVLCLVVALGPSIFIPVRAGCVATLLLAGNLLYQFERHRSHLESPGS